MVDRIEREVVLATTLERVWEVVTGPGWLAPEVQFELFPAGEASFRSEDWAKTGWVEEVQAPRSGDHPGARLVFWWSADGDPSTRVELTLEPEGESVTRLRVVEARPLEVLDLVGIPSNGSGRPGRGPTMLVGV
jgi:uncharacterized protein YndB with AHSA1/START domain